MFERNRLHEIYDKTNSQIIIRCEEVNDRNNKKK